MSKPNMYCGECPYWLAYDEPETTKEQKLAIEEHCRKCVFDFDPAGAEALDKMMRAARQQIVLRKAIHEKDAKMNKYVIHIPTGCCYPLEPDGKTVIICGAHLTPKIDGEIFWKYTDEYFEKVIVPSDPYANHRKKENE